MFLEKLEVAIGIAKQDVEQLDNIYELTTRDNMEYGRMRGHYAGGEYFFFKNGKELFRSSCRTKTINWLAKVYFNLK